MLCDHWTATALSLKIARDRALLEGLEEIEVRKYVAKLLETFGAFIHSADFGFCGTAGSIGLAFGGGPV